MCRIPAFFTETEGFEPSCRLPGKLISSQPRYDHFDTSPFNFSLYCFRFVKSIQCCDRGRGLKYLEKYLKSCLREPFGGDIHCKNLENYGTI